MTLTALNIFYHGTRLTYLDLLSVMNIGSREMTFGCLSKELWSYSIEKCLLVYVEKSRA